MAKQARRPICSCPGQAAGSFGPRHASPGEIDASFGSNTRKAVAAYREMKGLARGERIDEALWRALTETDQRPALKTYTISEADLSGPFTEKVPTDYREKAELPRLGYISVVEALAEKFHMSEKLLRRLNPDAAFEKSGTEIAVADVQRDGLPRKVGRIEIEGTQVRIYDKDETIVAIYPATSEARSAPLRRENRKSQPLRRTRRIITTLQTT